METGNLPEIINNNKKIDITDQNQQIENVINNVSIVTDKLTNFNNSLTNVSNAASGVFHSVASVVDSFSNIIDKKNETVRIEEQSKCIQTKILSDEKVKLEQLKNQGKAIDKLFSERETGMNIYEKAIDKTIENGDTQAMIDVLKCMTVTLKDDPLKNLNVSVEQLSITDSDQIDL